MVKSKVETFIGFSIKARKIALGIGAITALKGGVHLVIVDGNAAKNSKDAALKFRKRFSCPLLVCKSGFGDAVNKQDCKVAAIRDGQLAKAILDNCDGNYELYSGGDE